MALTRDLLDDLAARRAASGQAGADARAALAALFERGTFQEYGRYADHAVPGLAHAVRSLPGDGVVTGVGYVDGRPVAAFAQSPTTARGSVGRVHADRIAALIDHAGQAGIPVVGVLASEGGRIEEGHDVLAGYGGILSRLSGLSGAVPTIMVVAGPCPGIAAIIPGLADFVVMVPGATAWLSGPEVVAAVSGGVPAADELGGAAMHAEVSGLAHFTVGDVASAAALVRRLLGFLPANNRADPPGRDGSHLDVAPDTALDDMVVGADREGVDIRAILHRLVDDAEFLEVQAACGPSLVCGFARIGGLVAGVVASQRSERAGTLDIRACDKGARMVRFCDAFAIPVVTLTDTRGFLPGLDQEQGGLARAAARIAFAYAQAGVAKVTVVTGDALGGAGLVLGSRAIGADVVFAWPGADIGLTAAAAGRSPYLADGRYAVADVIAPSETAAAVGLALRTLAAKRAVLLPRRHPTVMP